MKISRILPFIGLCLLMSSCVTKKTWQMTENARLAAIYSRDSLSNLLDASRVESEELRSDTTRLGKSLRNYMALLNSNLSENQKLNAQLANKMKELDEREATINKLQRSINEQNQRLKELFDNVKKALMGFSSDELTVREQDGKVYVAMSDKLLFESGKAIVNEQGKAALTKLAAVLNKQTDIDIYIEGHTDSVPIKTAVFADNWDLSVIRATSVVRILTEENGVNPLQIQPCGRGEFKPVDTNETVDGRARNRRTEIILAPKLDKLFEMLKSQN